MNLKLKRPCKNCPFLKEGSIDLRPGRLQGIARDLVADDRTPFVCHKTLDGGRVEDEDGNDVGYQPGERDSVCVGSMVFLLKAQAPNVAMRMGSALKLLSFDDLRAQFDQVVEPNDVLG